MKIVLFVLTGLLIVIGAVWFLQGLNVLMGTAMSGQNLWTFVGAGLIVAGAVLGWFTARRKS